MTNLPTNIYELEMVLILQFRSTQDICNKLIEINFCVGCMFSQPNRLLQHLTTMSLINKIHAKDFAGY